MKYKCNIPEARWVILKGKDQYRQCKGFMAAKGSSVHEEFCRGSAEANSTCSKCGVTGFTLEPSGLSRAMKNHEVRCKEKDSYYKAAEYDKTSCKESMEGVAQGKGEQESRGGK